MKLTDETFFERFPAFFRHREEITDPGLVHGELAIDMGWRPIVWALLETLEADSADMGLDPASPEYPAVAQIKQKFGGLRVYLSRLPKGFYFYIQHAEMCSFRTCEKCGKPARPGCLNGIVLTLCLSCREDEREARGGGEWTEAGHLNLYPE